MAVRFCTCGSIINGVASCSNRNCTNHMREPNAPATLKQLDYIESLLNRLNRNDDITGITLDGASKLIDELIIEVERVDDYDSE